MLPWNYKSWTRTGTAANRADYRIGRAMFETSWIPRGWRNQINEGVHELWVPSHFHKQVFQQAGVKSTVTVIREGFDPSHFDEPVSPQDIIGFRTASFGQCLKDDVIFLSVADLRKRKGLDILIEVFGELFSKYEGKPGACLLIRSPLDDDYNERLRVLQEEGVRIFRLDRLTPRELLLAYRSADVFVLPTHGEGWGRPIMEAMAAGLPVIVPLWSGPTEFVKKDYSFAFPVTELEQATQWGDAWGEKEKHKWAHVNRTKLAEKIMYALRHPLERKMVGKKAREVMFEKFTMSSIVKDIDNRIIQISQILDT